MPITDKDRRRLHDAGGGECAYPDCRVRRPLEEAHIAARSEGGPRFNAGMTDVERDSYSNLMLLCANHHAEIDQEPARWTVEELQGVKSRHEQEIASRGTRVTELSGDVRATGTNVRKVVGAKIRRPTRFMPGTRITAEGEHADSVTGVEIGGDDDD